MKQIRRIRHKPTDFLMALLIIGVGLPLLAGGAAAAVFYFVPLPTVVPDPIPGALAQTSRVYAADGSLIASFHAEHNRELIELSEMPVHLQQAAIAAEDSRFYRHSGLDAKAIGRALLADIRAGATVQGGSTITQQYVKNAYLNSRKRTIFRKLREALVANQVERTYSKRKILKDYLNTVYLGKGAYGVQAAAKTYFDKPASQLTISESALLVGLIPSPVTYSPYERPQAAEARRRQVLSDMAEQGFIDGAGAAAAVREQPSLAPLKQQVLRYPWFVDGLLRSLMNDPNYGEGKLFTGGLQIHTTLDPRVQEAADRVVAETLPNPDDPHAALVSIDPRTGFVKAVVGGRQYGHETEKFNLAMQAHRSPGSSFKTFVLLAALEDGVSPASRFKAPGTLPIKGWGNACQCVHNFGGRGYGSMTLEQATVQSVNTVYVQLAQRLGVSKIVGTARKMGISNESLRKDEKNLAISIGGFTSGVTPFEMASAYATLAAGGEYRKPKFTTKIVDPAGNTLDEGPSPALRVIDAEVAATANEILKKVVSSGTAQRADIERPAAGKTGTAQNHNNAWFVGYTPDLSTAVWMGYRDAALGMKLVHGVRNVTGGTLPAQMWATFMRVALDGIPPSAFPVPGEGPRPGRTSFELPPPRPLPSSPKPKPSPPAVVYEQEPQPDQPPPPPPEQASEVVPTPSVASPSIPTCSLFGCR